MFAAPLLLAALAAPDHHLEQEAPPNPLADRLVAAAGADAADRPFGLIVSLTAKAGQEDALIAAYRAAATKSLAEEGCTQYALVRDVENPRQFTLLERWANAAALTEHLGQPYTKAFVGQFGDLLDDSGVAIVQGVGAGPAAE